MKILVINSGSSSIKYKLFNMNKKIVLAKGLVDRIGLSNSLIVHYYYDIINNVYKKKKINFFIKNHTVGLNKINFLLTNNNTGVIKSHKDIYAIGHRVVHGGNILIKPVLIDEKVKKIIKSFFSLAPLHNPANYIGIKVSEKVFSKSFQVAIFDTAFYSNLPEKSYRYALPEEFYKLHNIRVYGFHGISHNYITNKVINYLNNSKIRLISLHLGNGASVTAVKNGTPIETSMGFGPNNGLVMGTRCGDLDITVLFYALNNGYELKDLYKILNNRSGMLGLSEISSDMRDISKEYFKNNNKAKLAYEIYSHRIKKYIGSFVSVMNGIDVLVFTGGVGENDSLVRSMVCKNLSFFGIKLDEKKNILKLNNIKIKEIQKKNQKVKIFIISTDEEKQIAYEVFNFLNNL